MENNNKGKSYKEALREIEKQLVGIEDPEARIEDISADVKKALELIKLCKEELRSYRDECEKLLDQDQVKLG